MGNREHGYWRVLENAAKAGLAQREAALRDDVRAERNEAIARQRFEHEQSRKV